MRTRFSNDFNDIKVSFSNERAELAKDLQAFRDERAELLREVVKIAEQSPATLPLTNVCVNASTAFLGTPPTTDNPQPTVRQCPPLSKEAAGDSQDNVRPVTQSGPSTASTAPPAVKEPPPSMINRTPELCGGSPAVKEPPVHLKSSPVSLSQGHPPPPAAQSPGSAHLLPYKSPPVLPVPPGLWLSSSTTTSTKELAPATPPPLPPPPAKKSPPPLPADALSTASTAPPAEEAPPPSSTCGRSPACKEAPVSFKRSPPHLSQGHPPPPAAQSPGFSSHGRPAMTESAPPKKAPPPRSHNLSSAFGSAMEGQGPPAKKPPPPVPADA